jgi:hypothetical protein
VTWKLQKINVKKLDGMEQVKKESWNAKKTPRSKIILFLPRCQIVTPVYFFQYLAQMTLFRNPKNKTHLDKGVRDTYAVRTGDDSKINHNNGRAT